MDQPHEDEFADAIPLEKLHRYAIISGANALICFGLLGMDGVLRRFSARADTMSEIASEIESLAPAGRYVERVGSMEGYIPSWFAPPPAAWKDGLLPPHVGPSLKFNRSLMHFDELVHVLGQYARRVTVSFVPLSQDAKEVKWRVELSELPPANIPLIIGDYVHNLRSALDLMVCDLARMNGKNIDEVKFPFADSVVAFHEKRLKQLKKDIGDAAAAAILALRPYSGGDPLLRGLHDLDIMDKHRLVLPTFAMSWHNYDASQYMTDRMRRDYPGQEPPTVTMIGDELMTERLFSPGDTFTCPAGEEPTKYLSPHRKGIEARFSRLTRELPFGGEPVIPTLERIGRLVAAVLTDFQARFPATP